jgi:hypothetical protein
MHDTDRPRRSIRDRIGHLCTGLLDRLFADEDANALAHGWQIRRTRGGGRSYRDPRWDTIRCCELCGGTGWDTAVSAACQPCAGTGVIRSTPAVAANRTGVRG